jgi:hypothetical protein
MMLPLRHVAPRCQWLARAALLGLLIVPGPVVGFVSSPSQGQRSAGHVTLNLRAGEDPVRATLNGRRIDLGARRGGRHVVRLGAWHGSRHGRNVLRVTRTTRSGQRTRVIRFRVSPARPIAGAADRVVAHGGRVTLDAAPSRRAPGATTPLAYRWRLVSAPRGAAARTGLRPRALRAARLTVRTPVRGTYTFALTVRHAPAPARRAVRSEQAAGPASTTETVTVQAGPRRPLTPVRLNEPSAATNAIRVGDERYTTGGSCAAPAANVVALDRKTLALVRHRVVCRTISQEGLNQIGPDLNAALDGLTRDHLVLVKMATVPALRPFPPGVVEALGRIGVPPDLRILNVGAIGVPGMAPGEAAINDYPAPREEWEDGVNGYGDLTGYLTRTSHGYHGFLPGRITPVPPRGTPIATPNGPYRGEGVALQTDRVTASQGGVTTTASVVTRGSEQFRSDPIDIDLRGGGFHLVTFDSDRLRVLDNGTFITNNGARGGPDADAISELARRIRVAASAGPGTLLVLNSFGDPGGAVLDWRARNPNDERVGAWQELLDTASREFSASRYAFDSLTRNRNARYSAIAQIGSGQPPTENTDVLDPQATGRLNVLLLQGQTHRYRIDLESDGDERLSALNDLVMGSLSEWPFTSPAERAALAYLSQRADGVDDLRHSYWSSAKTDGDWNQVSLDLRGTPFPTGSSAFDQDTFERVRDGLVAEVKAVIAVRGLFDRLANPFREAGLLETTQLQSIAQQIDTQTAAPIPNPNQAKQVAWARLFGETLAAADKFSGIGEIGKVAALYKVALAAVRTELGGPLAGGTDQVPVRAAQLGADLAQRLVDAADGVNVLRAAVVGDYDKLMRAAGWAKCTTDSPPEKCPSEWQWSDDQNSAARDALVLAARRTFTLILLDVKYQRVRVTTSVERVTRTGNRGSFTEVEEFPAPSAREWSCLVPPGTSVGFPLEGEVSDSFRPLGRQPDQSIFLRPTAVGQWLDQQGELTGLLSRVRAPDGRYREPSAEIMNSVLAPINVNEPSRGGTGITRTTLFGDDGVFGPPVVKNCDGWAAS